MQFTITGYSTALFSTWYFVEELGVLFDGGDGIVSTLMHKARKVKHVFISHADRDHLTGLGQFLQLNAREGFPIIHYPADCGSFPAMEEFFSKFDPHVSDAVWKPIRDGEEIPIGKNHLVRAVRNGHVPITGNQDKSLSYKVVEQKNKLKPEFTDQNRKELNELIAAKGRDYVTEVVESEIFGFSGDTPVEDFGRWANTEVLIHEATFLADDDGASIKKHGNKHSKLDDVMEMASQSKIQKLILGHFSSRYSDEMILKQVANLKKKFGITIPIYCVLPGRTFRDILNQEPL